MRPSHLVLPVLALVAQGSAQINLNTLVSEVYSVYTEVTSIWASDASAASSAAAASSTDSSVTSTSSTASSSATSSSSTSSANPSSAAIAQNSASQTASSAAASATSSAATGHGTNHRTLAIVLGSVLGALVLGLLVLLLLLCCRRRRRRDGSTRNVHSPHDAEVESWRNGRSADTGRPGSSRGLLGGHHNREAAAAGAVVAPSMAEHPAYRNQNHDNPFVPTPPAARRTAPNSRAGLTDSVRPGEEPFLTDPKTGRPLNGNGNSSGLHNDNHHKGEALAAGLGGAALAGAAMHHHHKKEDERLARDHDHDQLHGDSRNHRDIITPTTGPSVLQSERQGEAGDPSNVLSSTHHHRAEEALGGAALTGAALHHHNKNDGAITGDSGRDHLIGDNATHDRSSVGPPGYTDDMHRDNHHRSEGLAAGLGGAGLAGAAMHHHDKNKDVNPYDHKHGHLSGGNSFSSPNTLNTTSNMGNVHQDHDNHHKGEALAAGLGGAGLAGAAMHHHNKKENEMSNREREASLLHGDGLTHDGSITRKPVASSNPISPVSPLESHSRPFPTTTSNDDAYALNKVPSRRSGESARRQSLSRDRATAAGVGNDGYSVPYESTQRNLRQPNTSHPLPSFNPSGNTPPKGMDGDDRSHAPLMAGAAGVGAGALAGAAVAHHRDRKSSKSRSRSRSRPSLAALGDKKRDSNSDYSTSTTNSGSYDDAMPNQPKIYPRPLSGTETRDMAAEMPEDVPPTPTTRSRRNSALGSGAPSAALGSYLSQPSPLGQSQTQPEDTPPVPAILPNRASNGHTAHGWGNGYSRGERVRRDQTPPAVPSRSPRRARFSDVPFDSAGEPVTSPSAGMARADGGIVGDNRYPHMGVPTRRSGDDFENVVPVRNEGPAPGMKPSMEADRDTSSEDSTWRLSSGMPGGWRKERTSSMGSGSGATNSNASWKRASGGWFTRDSGVSGMGSGGSRSGSMTSATAGGNGGGNGQGRRLRLADLRREEEERELRARGRKSMENEWSGNGGYDGYDHYHNDGVGQAM